MAKVNIPSKWMYIYPREREEVRSSPVVSGRSKRRRVVSSESEEGSPVGRERGKRARVLEESVAVGTVHQETLETSEEESLVQVQGKGGRRCAFLEVEAEVSGEEGSGDEAEEEQEGYEQSFVDDESPQGGGRAMYLRSLRSPPARPARPLPPLTAEVFSQEPPPDESYLEDSFCVQGSQVEEAAAEDTLDLLERRAELPSPVRPARKRRIAVRPAEDTLAPSQAAPVLAHTSPPPDSVSLLAAEVEVRAPAATSPTFLRPVAAGAAAGRPSVVVSSAELGRSAEVVSLLRHSHGLVVREWRTEEAQFVLGSHTALLRCAEAEFNNGAKKEQLVQKVGRHRTMSEQPGSSEP